MSERTVDEIVGNIVSHTESYAAKTGRMITAEEQQLRHAADLLNSEAGEICDGMRKFYYEGVDIDRLNFVEEGADLLYGLRVLCNALEVDLATLAECLEAKLKVRYPNGFDDASFTTRNKSAEREAMRAVLRKKGVWFADE